jgi:hypothetical protein
MNLAYDCFRLLALYLVISLACTFPIVCHLEFQLITWDSLGRLRLSIFKATVCVRCSDVDRPFHWKAWSFIVAFVLLTCDLDYCSEEPCFPISKPTSFRSTTGPSNHQVLEQPHCASRALFQHS